MNRSKDLLKQKQSDTQTLLLTKDKKEWGEKTKYLVLLWRRLDKLMRSRHCEVWQYFSQQVERICCLLRFWERDIYLINSWPFLMRRLQELKSDTDHSHSAMLASLEEMSSAILTPYLLHEWYFTGTGESQRGGMVVS